MTDAWQLLKHREPPFNTPLLTLSEDGSICQAQNINHKFVMPKTGYTIDHRKVTHWMVLPELPR